MERYDMAVVDEIRKRLDASYDEVLFGLEESGGDVLRALAAIERRRAEQRRAEESGELFGRAIGLAKEGRLRGLRISLGGRAARDLPLPKGYKGAVIAELVGGVLSQLKVGLVEGEPEEPAEPEAEDEQGAEE